MNRIAGLETEYGCLIDNPAATPLAITRVRDWIFREQRFGLIDVHQRDWDEPAGNGGFLFNGGRVYIDMGHLEYCTPECMTLLDIARYDAAGDAILLQAIKSLRLDREVNFIRNNIDHYSGATFGCHENYLVRRAAPLTETNIHSLLAFLTLRLLFVSAGRVGATIAAESRGEFSSPGEDKVFQISQRADYINNDLFEWVQFNRAIINTRDEPLADARKYRRLHLLHGDTNVLPATLLLKIGTTSLVLDLLEIDCLPKIMLADAVTTFRSLTHQLEGPWPVLLANGQHESTIVLLQKFYEAAQREFHGRDRETDDLLKIWKATLEALARDPKELVGQIDWITKYWLLNQFKEQENLEWNDAWLKSQDLEFHHIDPERSLGLALARTPDCWKIPAAEIEKCTTQPPKDTRAHARSHAMKSLRFNSQPYYVDWEIVSAEENDTLHLIDPFDASIQQSSPRL